MKIVKTLTIVIILLLIVIILLLIVTIVSVIVLSVSGSKDCASERRCMLGRSSRCMLGSSCRCILGRSGRCMLQGFPKNRLTLVLKAIIFKPRIARGWY